MKTKLRLRLVLLVLVFLATVPAAGAGDSKRNWSVNSAELVPAGRLEIGLFQPLRYGYSQKLEFSVHPLTFFIMPNLSVKWRHFTGSGTILSSRHSVNYPTLLLRTLAREGTGGIISPEFHIPHMVSFNNEVLYAKRILTEQWFSVKAGFTLAVKSGELDERTTIDLPLVFPRLLVFYHGYNLHGGADLQGKIIGRWHYLVDVDFFFCPRAAEKTAIEHKGLLLWNKSHRFQLCLGYKLCYGQYPFGSQWHLLGPLLDLQWARQVK